MATNLNINQQLLEEALKVGGLKTKRQTVDSALQEFIDRRKQKDIIELFGNVVYEPDYDYKNERKSR
jgi:hypothetical protein